jgi:hypothetical protein
MAMSRSPRTVDTSVVTSSGAPVPMATTVRPMIASLTSRSGNLDGAIDEQLSSHDDDRDPGHQGQHVEHRSTSAASGGWDRLRGVPRSNRLRLLAARPEDAGGVGDPGKAQHDPVHPGQAAVERQQPQRQAGRSHGGQVEPKRQAFKGDGPDRSAETQDEQDVDQVGPDNVAHRQTWASLSRRIDADGQLGQAGAERDDRKTDHDRPDAKAGGERGAATHQQLGSHEQPGESGQDEQRAPHVRRCSGGVVPG